MTTNTETDNLIALTKIEGEDERLNFLPSYFGNDFLMLENAMFTKAQKEWDEYSGGMWDFYIVTDHEGNTAPLMVWDTDHEKIHVQVETNFTDLHTTPLAASVALMQVLVNHLGWHRHNKDDEEKAQKYFGYWETLRSWTFTTTDLSDKEVSAVYSITD